MSQYTEVTSESGLELNAVETQLLLEGFLDRFESKASLFYQLIAPSADLGKSLAQAFIRAFQLSLETDSFEKNLYQSLISQVKYEQLFQASSHKQRLPKIAPDSLVHSLNFEGRIIFALRDVLGYSLEFISELLYISIEEVRAKLRQARFTLCVIVRGIEENAKSKLLYKA